LKERVVAIESLTTLADALRAAKPALLEHLRKTEKAVGIIKEVDGYFSRTVDAAQDLAVAIYRGGAKQLLGVSQWLTHPQPLVLALTAAAWS
jgi:ABC-type transporter Mla subunit MlaD